MPMNIESLDKDVLALLNVKLDQWIEDCRKQSVIFESGKMEVSSMTSLAMSHAYQNVKLFLLDPK